MKSLPDWVSSSPVKVKGVMVQRDRYQYSSMQMERVDQEMVKQVQGHACTPYTPFLTLLFHPKMDYSEVVG